MDTLAEKYTNCFNRIVDFFFFSIDRYYKRGIAAEVGISIMPIGSGGLH